MKTNDEPEDLLPVELAQQRQELRTRLQSQRQLIAQRMGPARVENTAYPRSMIMRFFAQRPGLATKLAVELAGVVVGARLIKSAGVAMGFVRRLNSR